MSSAVQAADGYRLDAWFATARKTAVMSPVALSAGAMRAPAAPIQACTAEETAKRNRLPTIRAERVHGRDTEHASATDPLPDNLLKEVGRGL